MNEPLSFNGYNVRVYDFSKIENAEKEIKILEKHGYEITNACYVKCAEHDGIEDTKEYRFNHLIEISSIDYGYNGKDVFTFGLVMVTVSESVWGKCIEIVHKMNVEVEVITKETGDNTITCTVHIEDDTDNMLIGYLGTE